MSASTQSAETTTQQPMPGKAPNGSTARRASAKPKQAAAKKPKQAAAAKAAPAPAPGVAAAATAPAPAPGVAAAAPTPAKQAATPAKAATRSRATPTAPAARAAAPRKQAFPVAEGLFQMLPDPGTKWPTEECVVWLQALSASFRLAYKLPDPLTVTVAQAAA